MKSACENCQQALAQKAEAYICSYECTFCRSCTDNFDTICPNCDGLLTRRPPRPAPRADSSSTASLGE
nr:DUF1272 domain-containing protein [Congregibacter litoralis]